MLLGSPSRANFGLLMLVELVMSDRNGWIICVASLFQIFTRSNMTQGFGVFIAEFRRLYKTKMAELDWMAVLPLTLTGLLSPIPSFVMRKIGKKGYAVCSFIGTLLMAGSCIASSFVNHVSWLFFTFSFLSGLGSSFIFMSSTLIIYEFFPADHRFHVPTTTSYAFAVQTAIMTSSSLFAWIMQITSWRTAFVIGGITVFIVGITCSLLFLLNNTSMENSKIPNPQTAITKIHDPLDKSNSNENSSDSKFINSKWREVCGTSKRFYWLFGVVVTFSTQTIPMFNLPHYMESKKYGKIESSLPLVSYSLSQIVAYLLFSTIGPYVKGRLIYGNIASCLLLSLLFVIWSFVETSFVVIMVFSAVAGAAIMLSFGYLSPSSIENMSMDSNISWTATCIAAGVGGLVSPILSGAIYDLRQSYDDVFRVVGTVCFFNGLIFIFIPVIDVLRKKKKNYDSLE